MTETRRGETFGMMLPETDNLVAVGTLEEVAREIRELTGITILQVHELGGGSYD